jgi:hypothetical protein
VTRPGEEAFEQVADGEAVGDGGGVHAGRAEVGDELAPAGLGCVFVAVEGEGTLHATTPDRFEADDDADLPDAGGPLA